MRCSSSDSSRPHRDQATDLLIELSQVSMAGAHRSAGACAAIGTVPPTGTLVHSSGEGGVPRAVEHVCMRRCDIVGMVIDICRMRRPCPPRLFTSFRTRRLGAHLFPNAAGTKPTAARRPISSDHAERSLRAASARHHVSRSLARAAPSRHRVFGSLARTTPTRHCISHTSGPWSRCWCIPCLRF